MSDLTSDDLLLEALREMDHARVFIRTREKMHQYGVQQFDEVWAKVRRHLERCSEGKTSALPEETK